MNEQRRVCFANSTIAIELDGNRAAEVVDFLYRNAPTSTDSPSVTYRLCSSDSGTLSLLRDGISLYEGPSVGYVAELLMGESCRSLAEQSKGGLLFHAAAASWQGKGILLPGKTGVGKTTLTAWLLTRGMDYLTDEMVYVPYGATTIQGFARPLNVKKAAWSTLKPYLPAEPLAEQRIESIGSHMLLPEALGACGIPDPIPLALIVFPHYQPEIDLALQSIAPARAGLMLMEVLANARNLPNFGFAESTRLCRAIPAYRLSYARLDQIDTALEHILS